MSFTFRFLGTGTSVGVPQIGCKCPVCTSSDPRDRRRRCGAYVRTERVGFLIDTPPEMRIAAIEYGIDKVDAVLLTHSHMDHVAGFDDVRRFNTINGTTVPCAPDAPGANGRTFRIVGATMRCFAMEETIEQMHRIFPYIGETANAIGLFRPMIHFVDNAEPFCVGGLTVERLVVEHGFPCCGYLLGGKFAYISDCHAIPETTLEKMKGVEILVLNCLRERPHPTHLNLESALGYISRIRPKRAYLTHMCHDLSHVEWLKKLPRGVEPAYDGLELKVED